MRHLDHPQYTESGDVGKLKLLLRRCRIGIDSCNVPPLNPVQHSPIAFERPFYRWIWAMPWSSLRRCICWTSLPKPGSLSMRSINCSSSIVALHATWFTRDCAVESSSSADVPLRMAHAGIRSRNRTRPQRSPHTGGFAKRGDPAPCAAPRTLYPQMAGQ